jgi:hypothetical protein
MTVDFSAIVVLLNVTGPYVVVCVGKWVILLFLSSKSQGSLLLLSVFPPLLKWVFNFDK